MTSPILYKNNKATNQKIIQTKNKAILIRLEGEEIALKIESLFLKKNIDIKARDSTNLFDMGMWRHVKSYSLEKGEIEIKELWFSAFFYRTQVAFRGEVPKEIVEDYLANLVRSPPAQIYSKLGAQILH